MRKFIRFDDIPARGMWDLSEYKKTLGQVIRMCNTFGVNYVIAAIPFEVTYTQAEWLHTIVDPRYGRIAMHGFRHAFYTEALALQSKNLPGWVTAYEQLMCLGGDFARMSEQECSESYKMADTILSVFFRKLYDPEHFIAPFNCYTQELVNTLKSTQVKYIHTCEKEYEEHKQGLYLYGHITPVISVFHSGYDYAGEVEKRIDRILTNGEQITLHWFYDVYKRPHWDEEYKRLLSRLAEEQEYTT